MAYVTNRSAKQHYEIIETVRSGIELLGTEVKSIIKGKSSLTGAKVLIRGGEIFLVGATIQPYQEKNTDPSYDPSRTRKLLLNKREINKLYSKSESSNLTLIPISIYTFNRRLKLDIGIARKKNSRDKREDIKRRDSERSIKRQMKR